MSVSATSYSNDHLVFSLYAQREPGQGSKIERVWIYRLSKSISMTFDGQAVSKKDAIICAPIDSQKKGSPFKGDQKRLIFYVRDSKEHCTQLGLSAPFRITALQVNITFRNGTSSSVLVRAPLETNHTGLVYPLILSNHGTLHWGAPRSLLQTQKPEHAASTHPVSALLPAAREDRAASISSAPLEPLSFSDRVPNEHVEHDAVSRIAQFRIVVMSLEGNLICRLSTRDGISKSVHLSVADVYQIGNGLELFQRVFAARLGSQSMTVGRWDLFKTKFQGQLPTGVVGSDNVVIEQVNTRLRSLLSEKN